MPLPLSPFPAVVGQQYQIVIIISINKWQQYANINVNNNLSVWPFGEGGYLKFQLIQFTLACYLLSS